jgi:uncharacterized protein (DUF58 family)
MSVIPIPTSPARIARPTRRYSGIEVSFSGVFYLLVTLFMGMAAINVQANLLFWVFGMMVGSLGISWVICWLVLKKLTVKRNLPEALMAGQPTFIQYQFHNGKRFWPSLSVSLTDDDGAEAFYREPHAYMLHTGPRMSATISVQILPKRRGLYSLSTLSLFTSFPFGFIRWSAVRKQEDKILIYPAIGEVSPRLLMMCQSRERSGDQVRPRRGGQDEFFGVKPYRVGENPRLIHWKRSASTGELVSKEMAHISPPRIMLLVDTFQHEKTKEYRVLIEKTLAMAASLASKAMEVGTSAGLCIWDGSDWKLLLPQRGKQYCREILTALACVAQNTEHDADSLISHCASTLRGGVTPVVLSPMNIQFNRIDVSRLGLLAISAGSKDADAFFHFSPSVNFGECVPADK